MVVREAPGEMTLTEDHTKNGKHAVRIRSTPNIGAPNPSFDREANSDQGKSDEQ
jgi:hypothetical protein